MPPAFDLGPVARKKETLPASACARGAGPGERSVLLPKAIEVRHSYRLKVDDPCLVCRTVGHAGPSLLDQDQIGPSDIWLDRNRLAGDDRLADETAENTSQAVLGASRRFDSANNNSLLAVVRAADDLPPELYSLAELGVRLRLVNSNEIRLVQSDRRTIARRDLKLHGHTTYLLSENTFSFKPIERTRTGERRSHAAAVDARQGLSQGES
jgi:hypothetical protein